jgi:hypothetical protein
MLSEDRDWAGHKGFLRLRNGSSARNHLPLPNHARNGFLTRLGTIPAEENSMNLAGVVQQLQKERDQAARTVQQLDAALAALDGGSYGRRTGARRKISAAGRARIAAAQRARWARARTRSGQKQNVVSMPKRKTMSAAARRKIAAAQRARWTKVKAAQKKSA